MTYYHQNRGFERQVVFLFLYNNGVVLIYQRYFFLHLWLIKKNFTVWHAQKTKYWLIIVTTPTTAQRNTTSTQWLGMKMTLQTPPTHQQPQELNSSLCEPQNNIHWWDLDKVWSATTSRATTTTTSSTTKLSALGTSD